mmetsp:Transcript_9091/g.22258  ORF Transcript_9091/g.22258 Transcript_9091/m.22258 type:complete len:211 (-) Transcript_9091:293-925(-)
MNIMYEGSHAHATCTSSDQSKNTSMPAPHHRDRDLTCTTPTATLRLCWRYYRRSEADVDFPILHAWLLHSVAGLHHLRGDAAQRVPEFVVVRQGLLHRVAEQGGPLLRVLPEVDLPRPARVPAHRPGERRVLDFQHHSPRNRIADASLQQPAVVGTRMEQAILGVVSEHVGVGGHRSNIHVVRDVLVTHFGRGVGVQYRDFFVQQDVLRM